jgi:hypothetical protein
LIAKSSRAIINFDGGIGSREFDGEPQYRFRVTVIHRHRWNIIITKT